MKISFVLPGYSRAAVGGYRVVYEYARRLAENGHSVALVHASQGRLVHANGRMPPLTIRGRLRHIRDHLLRPRSSSWFDLPSQIQYMSVPRLRASHMPSSDVVVATACWTAPFVNSLPASCGEGAYFIQHYETWSAPKAFVDATWRLPLSKIVIARWLQRIGEGLGVESVYVPNAIDVSDFPYAGGLADRRYDVVARYSSVEWKRPDVLVAVLERLQTIRPGVSAVLFGVESRPSDLPRWVDYVRSPERSILSAEIYGQSRVYLCCSDAEGWHLPPAEAMATGATVVSTNIEGVREYADGVARFAEVGNVGRLADAVVSLLENPAEAEALGRLGAERIRHYGPDDAFLRFERALLEIANNRAA